MLSKAFKNQAVQSLFVSFYPPRQHSTTFVVAQPITFRHLFRTANSPPELTLVF